MRMRRDEALDRRDERGERALHVGRAAPVQVAVAHDRHERIGAPRLARPGRHDVGVAGEADERRARAAPRPQVGDAVATRASRTRSRAAASRAAISAWQPASSGVSERRAIELARQRERGLRRGVHARDVSRPACERFAWRCTRRGGVHLPSERFQCVRSSSSVSIVIAAKSAPGPRARRASAGRLSIASTRERRIALVDLPGEVGRRVGRRSSPRRR